MPTFFQAVYVPERCFLSEALLWVAFQRLPVVQYNDEVREIHDATENEGYELETPEGPLTEDECKRAGIPQDPHFLHLIDESPSPSKSYEELEPKYGRDEGDTEDQGSYGQARGRIQALLRGMAAVLRPSN
jgi:hypothetical protein